MRGLVFGALLGTVWGLAVPALAQSRPPCTKVLSEAHRHVREFEGSPPGVGALAERLRTDDSWVLFCLESYGRFPARRRELSRRGRRAIEEAIEEGRELEEATVEVEEEELEGQKLTEEEFYAQERKERELEDIRRRRGIFRRLRSRKEFDPTDPVEREMKDLYVEPR